MMGAAVRSMHDDPGTYDREELTASVVSGRFDAPLMRARAWCGDVQGMCMYADWLLHASLDPVSGAPPAPQLREARRWLGRAAGEGSAAAGELLIEAQELEAAARRWGMRAAARGDLLGEALLADIGGAPPADV